MRTKEEQEAQNKILEFYDNLPVPKTPQQKYRIEEAEHKKVLEKREKIRQSNIKKKITPNQTFMNHLKAFVWIDEITEQMITKEEEFGEYLHNNDYK